MLSALSAPEILHATVHLVEWFWPFQRGPTCPACVCNAGEPVIVERVPEAVTSALQFAQQQCSSPASSSDTSGSSCWSFSLFWIGLIAGFVIALVLSIVIVLCIRAVRRLCTENETTEDKPTSTPRATSSRVIALADGEPANPRTLRQLGILR